MERVAEDQTDDSLPKGSFSADGKRFNHENGKSYRVVCADALMRRVQVTDEGQKEYHKKIYLKRVLILGDLDLRGVTFNRNVVFGGCIFSGKANFWYSTFSGEADFEDSTFSGQANFGRSNFIGKADFGVSTFSGEADFGNSTFSGFANFSSLTLSGASNFAYSTFSRAAYFKDTKFFRKADFGNSTFSGFANFKASKFSGEAYFGVSKFSGVADFSEAKFYGKASFYQLTFSKSASFSRSIFTHEANFVGLEFSGETNFVGLEFSGETYFIDCIIKGKVRLANTKLTNRLLFQQTKEFSKRYNSDKMFQGPVELDSLTLSGDGEIKFQGCQGMEEVSFPHTDISEIKLFDVDWGLVKAGVFGLLKISRLVAEKNVNPYRLEEQDQIDARYKRYREKLAEIGEQHTKKHVKEEIKKYHEDIDQIKKENREKESKVEIKKNWRELQGQYSQLRSHFEDKKDFTRSEQFYYPEMEAKFQRENWPTKLLMWFYKLLSAYSLSIIRPFLFLISLVFIFAGAYRLTDLSIPKKEKGRIEYRDSKAQSGKVEVPKSDKGQDVRGKKEPKKHIKADFSVYLNYSIRISFLRSELPLKGQSVGISLLNLSQMLMTFLMVGFMLFAVRKRFKR